MYTCVYIYIYTYVHVYIYIYIYTCIHIHTCLTQTWSFWVDSIGISISRGWNVSTCRQLPGKFDPKDVT